MEQKQGQDRIQILTTLDQNYLPRLQVLLTSLYLNQPDEKLDIWLLHSRIPEEALIPVTELCSRYRFGFFPVQIDGTSFQDAPVSRQYPKEMYYRLLAAQFLPMDLHRIIYLDPDILVINPLRPLWDMDMKGNLFAAASHTGMTELANNINQFRLETDHDYYNSGVLLMDLDVARNEIHSGLDFIEKYNVITGKALSGHLGESDENGQVKVLATTKVICPNEICTESYIVIGKFDSELEAKHLFHYLRTKISRFLLLQALPTLDIRKERFVFVPLQDFTVHSDINWNCSIPEIDRQLYTKYHLTNEEIAFIEKMIKPM